MFKGFKLKGIDFGSGFSTNYSTGLELHNQNKSIVESSLDSFFFDEKSLDGTKIIESWFPQIDAHIFISHSRKDKDAVIALSGWLYENFGLKSFIDSCIWGYGNDLIQMLDNKYSWLDETHRAYDYNKVVFTSSHVHMMLSTALFSMIDKTECLFFYDTHNSIESFDSVDKTESPWIYSEIAFSEIVRRTTPPRIATLLESRNYSSLQGGGSFEKSLNIKYDVNSKHLKEIDHTTLNEWFKYNYKGDEALDKLYEITFPVLNPTN